MRKKCPKHPSHSCLLRRTSRWATLGKEEELYLLPEEKMGNKRVSSPHLWKAESCSVITCTQEESVCEKPRQQHNAYKGAFFCPTSTGDEIYDLRDKLFTCMKVKKIFIFKLDAKIYRNS